MARQVLAQTTTNGLRVRRCGKYFLTPGAGEAATQWGQVRVKWARGFGVTHCKPEYDDVARLAREHGVSFQDVQKDAIRNLSCKEEEKQ